MCESWTNKISSKAKRLTCHIKLNYMLVIHLTAADNAPVHDTQISYGLGI